MATRAPWRVSDGGSRCGPRWLAAVTAIVLPQFTAGDHSAWVMVRDVTDTVAPATIAVVFRFRSHPVVPTEPSITPVTPSDLYARNHAAVPVAAALVSETIGFAVAVTTREPATPVATGVPNAVAANVIPPDRSVCPVRAVFASAGWAPL